MQVLNFLYKNIFWLLLCVMSTQLLSQSKYKYNHKEFGTYFEVFEYKQDLMNFLDIKSGDVIADIGSGDAKYAFSLSLLYDNIKLYAEDIDTKELNQKNFDKYVKHFYKLKGTTQTNEFHFSIGTYTSTNLPDNTFDKIIMLASFHEFTYMDEMIADLNIKLKPGGKIYILEAFSLKDKTIYCADKHKGYRIDEVKTILAKQGFHLTHMRNPEGNIINYANGLIFEKDALRSKTFSRNKELVEPFIAKTRLFDNQTVTSNGQRMQNITDSIAAHIDQINSVYSAFECYLIDIGNKLKKKKDLPSAINVLKMATTLFPNSVRGHSLLAGFLEENQQYDLAILSYKRVYELEPNNPYSQTRLKKLQLK